MKWSIFWSPIWPHLSQQPLRFMIIIYNFDRSLLGHFTPPPPNILVCLTYVSIREEIMHFYYMTWIATSWHNNSCLCVMKPTISVVPSLVIIPLYSVYLIYTQELKRNTSILHFLPPNHLLLGWGGGSMKFNWNTISCFLTLQMLHTTIGKVWHNSSSEGDVRTTHDGQKTKRRWRSGLEHWPPTRMVWCSNLSRDRLNS